MRVKLGLCGIALLTALLLACGGGSSTPGGGGGGKVTLQSIVLGPSAPGINVGDQQQFTATGHYSDNSTKDLTSTATWASSDTTIATVTKAGLATGVFRGQASITATSGTVVGSTALTVNPLLTSISISPLGPAVQVGQKQAFTATGSFNDNGPTADLTSTATWSSSNTAVATVNAGQATGVANGVAAITAQATAADGTVVNGTTALHVVNNAPPALSGSYAFVLLGADSRGTQFYMGSFTLDGNGTITGGVEDANTGSGVTQGAAVSGTYTVFEDGRGEINLASNVIHPNGLVLRFVADSAGTSGKLIEFDGAGTLRGSFEKQSIGNTLDNATYVFRLGGADSASAELGELGVFAADGAGNIASGTVDINDHGSLTTKQPLTPSTYTSTPDANGRGTLTITGVSTATFAYYLIDKTKLNLIQLDSVSPTTAIGGVAEEQAAHAFVAADLNGGLGFLLENPVIVGNPNRGEFNTMGRVQFDGLGGVVGTVSEEDEDEATGNPQIIQSGSYAFNGGVNGRGSVDIVLGPSDARTMLFYMVSTSKMFMMRTNNGVAGVLTSPTGAGELQTGPLNRNALNGSYTLAASELSEENVENLGLLDFDGAGNLSGIVDTSIAGSLSSNVIDAGTYSITTTTGRGPITTAAPENNYIFYLLSSTKSWVMGVKGADTDGSLEKR